MTKYPRSILPGAKRSMGKTLGNRVLVRAVTMSEIEGGQSGLLIEGEDARKCPYYEVVQLGDDVQLDAGVGDLVQFVTTALDVFEEGAKYGLVRGDHLIFAIDRDQALLAEEYEADSKAMERRRANGMEE